MTSRLGRGVAIVATVYQLAAEPVAAHHSFAAEYDGSAALTVKGTIVRLEWVNPHSWLYVAVKNPQGKIQTWRFELSAPNALYRGGWRKEVLAIGAEVTVTGFRATDGSLGATVADITLPNGKKLLRGAR